MVRYFLGLSLLVLLVGCTNSQPQANTQTSAEELSSETHASSPQRLMPPGLERDKFSVDEIGDFIDLNVPEGFARGTTEAIIIDTGSFKEPIGIKGAFRGKIVVTGDDEEGEISVPVARGVPNKMPVGGLMDPAFRRVGPISSFPGIQQTEFSPPDPSLAVGPEHIVEVVNSAIAIYTKDGTATFTQRLNSRPGQPGFFQELAAEDFVFDPKVMYDPTIERFFIVALELIGADSFINIAISDDEDPNGIWFRYRTCSTVQIGDGFYFFDYPGWGYDEDGIYVTGNLFLRAGTGPNFVGALFRSFDKTPLLVGDPALFTDISNPGAFSVQCAQTFGNNSAPFFIGGDTFSSLEIIALQDPLGSPSFDSFRLTVPSFGSAGSAPNGNGNGGSLIQTVDTRVFNINWRDGSLWAAHTVGGNDGSAAVARWYEIATNDWPQSGVPTLEQSGEIDPGNSVSTFFPAIYTDAAGNTAVVMAHSSPTETASVAISGRIATDPPGMMSEPIIFATGDFATTGRWGDYFDIALDPTDNTTFWTIGEVTSSSAGGWITSIDSIQVSPPPTVAGVELNVGEAQRSAVESITITLDGDVEFAEGAISVVQRSTATQPTFAPVSVSVSQQLINDQTIATVQFDSLVRNSENALVDGNYQLTLTADLVTRSGVPMSEDFVFGDEESDGFFVFYGDSDGNRTVNVFDLLSFRQSFGTFSGDTNYSFFMDFDAGGSIDVFDLLQFRIRFGNTLPFTFGSSLKAPLKLQAGSVTPVEKLGTGK